MIAMMLTRFLRDNRGSATATLGLLAIPLIGFVGAAIDFSRAASARTSMLAALDSTALMLSKEAQDLDAAQLQQKADAYFKALFQHPEAQNVQLTQTFGAPQEGNFSLKITGNGSVKTMFTKIMGQTEINFSASSEVLWGIKKLEIALALDNTGSMESSGKMTALKSAAHNLLETLKKAAKEPDDVKVSIVPFAVDVNVDKANVNAPWIDWTDWENENGTCSKMEYKTKSSCTSNGKIWTPDPHSKWNGCVKDRDQNNDVSNAPTGSSAAVNYRAHQSSACPTSMMVLSSDWTALNNKIDQMIPTGATNVTIGMQLAWQTLTPAAPFMAQAEAPDREKVLILLTDGQNTQNRWSSSTYSIDLRTQKICDNLKATNIKVYTVRVIDGNGTLLKNCATKPDMYFDVDEAAQLNSVFKSIAQNLANLRITK